MKKKILAILCSAFIAIFASISPWGYVITVSAERASATRRDLSGMIGNSDIWYGNSNLNYFISPRCAIGSVADIDGGSNRNGTNCHLWKLNFGYNQQFKLIRAGRDSYGPYFMIVKANSNGKCLDVSGGQVRNGQNIQLWERNGTRAQQWYIKPADNKTYYVISRLNVNYAMDVNGAYSSNGTNFQLWQRNNTNAQKFCFYTCNHARTRRFSTLCNDWSDMIWVAGWECKDCHAVLQNGTWTLPNE